MTRDDQIATVAAAFHSALPPSLAVHLLECESCLARLALQLFGVLEEEASLARLAQQLFPESAMS